MSDNLEIKTNDRETLTWGIKKVFYYRGEPDLSDRNFGDDSDIREYFANKKVQSPLMVPNQEGGRKYIQKSSVVSLSILR